jgi:chromosome segregation ATPase
VTCIKIILFYFILELKNTLESIINQNQVLAEVMKSVDSTCPDPFNEPEKFSVYFAQKSISINSLSDEFEEENQLFKSKSSSSSPTTAIKTDVENALGRLQNLRMEEQRGFQIERENFETRLGQLALLQQEIELLRKENSEHEIQIEFLKSQNNLTQPDSEVKFLKSQLQTTNSEITAAKSEIEGLNTHFNLKEAQLIEKIENLTKELENLKESKELENLEKIEEFKQSNEKLKVQLEEALLKFKTLKETLEGQEEKERQFREISEENVRLKIEFDQLKRELSETRTQLTDLEVFKNYYYFHSFAFYFT